MSALLRIFAKQLFARVRPIGSPTERRLIGWCRYWAGDAHDFWQHVRFGAVEPNESDGLNELRCTSNRGATVTHVGIINSCSGG